MKKKIKLNIENIDKLIGLMKRIPDDKFNIRTFQSNENGTHKMLKTERGVLNNCGTTCCISGWIRVSPEFKELQKPQFINDRAFVHKKLYNGISESIDYRASSEDYTVSIAMLLGIPDMLADALIYYSFRLYDRYLPKNYSDDNIKPAHVISILEDIKTGKLVWPKI